MDEKFPEGWDRVARIFSGQPVPDHPDFFVERVMGEIRRPAPASRPSRAGWWWVPALAPALALSLLMAAGTRSAVSTAALLEAPVSGSDAGSELSRPSTTGLLELL